MVENTVEALKVAQEGFNLLSKLITTHIEIMQFAVLAFAIISFVKLIINRKNKVEVINNILDILKYIILFGVMMNFSLSWI